MFTTVAPTAPIEARPDYTRPLIVPSIPLEVVKVQSDDTDSGYVIINVSDFDASVHKKFVDKSSDKQPKRGE